MRPQYDAEDEGARWAGVQQELATEALILQAAVTAHHASQGYCLTLGDESHQPWVDAPAWQRQGVISGVRKVFAGEINTPEEAHANWMREKEQDGWVFGPVKDGERKTHPCLVPYNLMPEDQRLKDELFFAVVNVFKP